MTPALHPSCMLNEDWKFYLKPPSAAYQVFYIRFTCNGHIPVIPYYKLKVGFGADEAISVTAHSSTSKPDLAGPFTNSEMLSEAYAYLYYYRQGGTNRTLFSHWYEVESGWDYASAFKPMEGSCEYVDNYQYLFQPRNITPVPGCDLFVKRAEWKKHLVDLFTLTPTYELIGETLYPIFTINFDNLYILMRNRSTKKNLTWYVDTPKYEPPPTPECNTSAWEASYYQNIEYYGANSSALLPNCTLNEYEFDSSNWDWDDFWGNYYTGEYWVQTLNYVDYLSSFTGGRKQFIISDNNGNVPTFTAVEVKVNRLYTHIRVWMWLDGDETQICESINQLVEEIWTSAWSLYLTPSSNF